MMRKPVTASEKITCIQVAVAVNRVHFPIESCERMPTGLANQVFKVTVGPKRRPRIVRCNYQPEVLAGTVANLEALRGLGLPTPRLLAKDLSRERAPFAFIVLDWIPGRDLLFELDSMTPAQMTKLAHRLTRIQRRAAQLPLGEAFGWAALGTLPTFSHWEEVVRHTAGRGLASVDGGSGRAAFAAMIDMGINHFQRYFATVEPRCYLDDLTTKNVLVERGMLTGIIDFDWLGYGDLLFWPGLLQTAVYANHAASAHFYVEEVLRLLGTTPVQRAVVDFYAGLHALTFIGERPHGERRLPHETEKLLTLARRWLQPGQAVS